MSGSWLLEPPDGGDVEVWLWLALPGYYLLDEAGKCARWWRLQPWPYDYAPPARWVTLAWYFGTIALCVLAFVLLAVLLP